MFSILFAMYTVLFLVNENPHTICCLKKATITKTRRLNPNWTLPMLAMIRANVAWRDALFSGPLKIVRREPCCGVDGKQHACPGNEDCRQHEHPEHDVKASGGGWCGLSERRNVGRAPQRLAKNGAALARHRQQCP